MAWGPWGLKGLTGYSARPRGGAVASPCHRHAAPIFYGRFNPTVDKLVQSCALEAAIQTPRPPRGGEEGEEDGEAFHCGRGRGQGQWLVVSG